MVEANRYYHQDSTVSPKTNRDDTAARIDRIVRHAGYKRPTALQSAVVPLFSQGKDLVIEAQRGEGKTGAMILPLLLATNKRSKSVSIILTDSAEEVGRIHEQFRRFTSRVAHKPTLTAIGKEASPHKELRALRKRSDILVGTTERVIDHIRRDNLSLVDVGCSVLDVPNDVDENGYDKDVLFIYSKMSGKQQTVAFLENLETSTAFDSILRRPQQITKADWHTGGSSDEEMSMSDNDQVSQAVDEMIRRIKEVESPDILNYYRKIFKKSIPFSLRGYVGGYLLKEHLGREGVDAEDGTKSLFVSIGKNRKVYPKDLAKLFAESLHIDQTLIGNIKVLDSYSFIEVPKAHAEKAIELLNDTEYRGRKITVNYARKKRK